MLFNKQNRQREHVLFGVVRWNLDAQLHWLDTLHSLSLCLISFFSERNMNSMNSKNRRMVCEYKDTAERVQCFLFAHFDCLGLTKYMKAHELLTDSLLQLP